MSLAFLFHFLCVQHVSDINISNHRSLRLFCCITTLVYCSWFDVCWNFETPTHIEQRTNNQCGNSTELSQAPDDGYINVRNMLST